MNLRIATPEDASALLKIYAPYVLKTAITFEYEIPSEEEFRGRITHTLERFPYLVAVEDNHLVGYAYVSAFKSRAAYDWSIETSIYVDEAFIGSGIGRALYTALENILKLQKVCNLCACIAYPNPPSIRFHESFGYQTVAHFHKSGYKLNAWHDMVWMEKELCPHTIPPQEFIPFPKLDSKEITAALQV